MERARVYIQDYEFQVEIADEIDERQRGLMNRQSIGDNEGMLFIWTEEEKRAFWMKNTFIALDIIFLNRNFEIINIAEAVPCKEDPCERYFSESPAQYVLEIPQGLSRQNNWDKGMKINVVFDDELFYNDTAEMKK